MPSDFVVFGRDPALSLLELNEYCQARNNPIQFKEFMGQAAIVETGQEWDIPAMMAELGGTVKIGSIEVDCAEKELSEKMASIDWAQRVPAKFRYSISDYTPEIREDTAPEIVQTALKDCFKQQRLKAVLKWPKARDSAFAGTTPTQLRKQKQLSEGLDVLMLESGVHVWVGKTIGVSDPIAWKERDLHRPSKKEFVQTSIRLSKILLNLSRATRGKNVLDPFCGTGSILMEGLLLGCNVVGVDHDKEMVASSKQNTSWLKEQRRVNETASVFLGDAKTISKEIRGKNIDCVATEPDLGPYWRGKPNANEAKQAIQKLEVLYGAFFRELKILMARGKRVCIIFPEIPSRDGKRWNVSGNVFETHGFREIKTPPIAGYRALPYAYKAKNSLIVRKVHVLERA